MMFLKKNFTQIKPSMKQKAQKNLLHPDILSFETTNLQYFNFFLIKIKSVKYKNYKILPVVYIKQGNWRTFE